MNISKVSLFNFDGVEGLVETTIEPRLSRIPLQLVRGIRFLLDRTYRYGNDTGLAGQYVRLTIKYQDERLQLTRHVDTPDFILMDQRQVPVRMYFWDLGETLARIDADWLADVVSFSNKHWMDILTRSTVQQGQNEAPINFNFEHVGLAQWKSFRSRRLEQVERLVERNDLIKRCRSIGKCRNKFLKRSIGDVEHCLSHITGQLSRDCNAIQAQAHALAQEIVSDQTKVFAALQSVIELYHDVDMDVADEFSQLYQTIQNEAHQVSSSISAVNASQRSDYQAVVLGSEGNAEETKEFRLQFTTGCLELARTPGEAQINALEEERLRLNERYSTWHVDYRAAQGHLEEHLHRHEQYVLDLDGAAAQLDADLSDWLAAMDQVNRRNKTLLKESNRRAVDKISMRAHLEEIWTVLSSSTAAHDEACQHGLSSVLRLLERDEYAAAKQSEFLGPIFESIRFKQDTDIVLQTYFRAKLQAWHSVIVVRSVAFAHRLMTDFNARQMRGTISIMACDNYRRPADDAATGVTKGVTLADVLDIAEGHPLLQFFSTLVYDAAAEWPEDLSDDVRDPLTGGLTLRTVDYPVAGIQYEKLLQQYYSVDQELIALERYTVPVEEIERSVRVQVQVMDARLRDLTGLVRSGAQIIQGQRAVQTELLYLGRTKDALTRIDLRQRINGKLIDLLARGGLELSPSTYAAQIDGLLGTPACPATAPSGTLVALYDPLNTGGQLEYLQFVMDFDVQSSSFWPVLPTAIVRETCCYVDRELSVEERVSELSAAHRGQLSTLNEHYRSVLRCKRTRRMYASVGMDIHVDPSRTLSTREHLNKPLTELDGELRRMGAEYNVRVRSRAYPKRVINCARRIRDYQQGLGTDAIQQSLMNYVACEKSEPQLDLLNKLWPHVKQFYDVVRPDALSEVELVWQATAGGEAGRHLSFKDMDGVEVVLRSASQGQFSIRVLGPRAQQVFGIAVLYAKLKINDIRVVTVSSDIETALSSETLRGILNLFSANNIQILLH